MRSISDAAKMPSAPLTAVQRGQAAARESSEAEKNACSIDAILNGGTWKWGQGANLDKISRFPSLPACHGNGKWEMGNGKWEMGNGKWKWGQGANLDKISRFPSLSACHEAYVLNFPVPITT